MRMKKASTRESRTLTDNLRSTLGKMEVALGSISDSIVWTDAQGRLQWCNASFDRLVGKPHIALIGGDIADLLPLKEHGVVLPKNAHPFNIILRNRSDKAGYYEFAHGEEVRSLEILGRYEIRTMHTQEATLEDIFIKLTGRELQ